jgi:predicted ATPase
VVVLAGPNGVGKSRFVESILQELRSLSGGHVSLEIEATSPAEEEAWQKKTLDTTVEGDRALLRTTLQKSQTRRNFESSILNFESDRSIQHIQPYTFSWDAPDPWAEMLGWDFSWNFLRNRFQDTMHAIFRKVHSLEREIASKARELQRRGEAQMALDFEDPLASFKDVFSQLLAPKKLLDAEIKNQRLTYEYDGEVFGLETLSSGEKEVLNITFDFLLRAPSHCIVFFDEPELHLHPELSYRLLNTLRSIGTRNQFILCTHSPDIISATLDQSVIFIAPKKETGGNQAIVVREDDQTNQALRLLGHSIGIVALGKKIVLVEGNSASLDKQLYGSILKNEFPSLVLVPSGGKHTITSFASILENVLEKSIWGVEFFMLCDGDARPPGADATKVEADSKGKLRILAKYHLENYFLDEAVLASVFEHLEKPDSWLKSSGAIREELRQIAQTLVSYAVALIVSREFRLKVGNVDLMPADCHSNSEQQIGDKIVMLANDEKKRVDTSLDEGAIRSITQSCFSDLNKFIEQDDPRWKNLIPGKVLLAKFASKAKMDIARLKTAYIHCSEKRKPDPFLEVRQIFADFAK